MRKYPFSFHGPVELTQDGPLDYRHEAVENVIEKICGTTGLNLNIQGRKLGQSDPYPSLKGVRRRNVNL